MTGGRGMKRFLLWAAVLAAVAAAVIGAAAFLARRRPFAG